MKPKQVSVVIESSENGYIARVFPYPTIFGVQRDGNRSTTYVFTELKSDYSASRTLFDFLTEIFEGKQ
jgi:hypothetical protein